MKQYGKRVLALLAAAMLCLSVTGCGSKDQSSGIGNETSGASIALASSSEEPLSVPDADAKKESDTASTLHANVLVVYFSYTGHLDSIELQINCFFVSQSTFDLGGFPFALHITQASTASTTAFLHFIKNPLADYAVCERSVQQNYLIKAPPSCPSPQIRLMKSERQSNQPNQKL